MNFQETTPTPRWRRAGWSVLTRLGVLRRTLPGFIGLAGLLGCGSAPPADDGSLASHPERPRIVYYAVFFERGPNWSDSRTAGGEALSRQRTEYLQKHTREGRIVAAGSFQRSSSPDSREPVGMALLSVRSQQEAQALVELDPAVRAGRLVFRIKPWLGPAGLQVGPR